MITLRSLFDTYDQNPWNEGITGDWLDDAKLSDLVLQGLCCVSVVRPRMLE